MVLIAISIELLVLVEVFVEFGVVLVVAGIFEKFVANFDLVKMVAFAF